MPKDERYQKSVDDQNGWLQKSETVKDKYLLWHSWYFVLKLTIKYYDTQQQR